MKAAGFKADSVLCPPPPQLLKKLIHCGDTSCLVPLLAVAKQEDRALLQGHCHSTAKRVLEGSRDEGAVREAVAYLSIAIMASGEHDPIGRGLIFLKGSVYGGKAACRASF